MPYEGSPVDEAAHGTTNILRLSTETAGDIIEDVYIMGNLLIGGGYTMTVHARYASTTVQNVVIANNILGTVGTHVQYGGITDFHKTAHVAGTHRNMILHNNKTNLGAGLLSLAGVDQNGLWHYNKQFATREFIEMGQKFGYLDWNGDVAAGVTNRSAA
jgi:hypothetical protein